MSSPVIDITTSNPVIDLTERPLPMKSTLRSILTVIIAAIGSFAAMAEWIAARDLIASAYDASAVQIQQVNGQATLDILTIVFLTSMALVVTHIGDRRK